MAQAAADGSHLVGVSPATRGNIDSSLSGTRGLARLRGRFAVTRRSWHHAPPADSCDFFRSVSILATALTDGRALQRSTYALIGGTASSKPNPVIHVNALPHRTSAHVNFSPSNHGPLLSCATSVLTVESKSP